LRVPKSPALRTLQERGSSVDSMLGTHRKEKRLFSQKEEVVLTAKVLQVDPIQRGPDWVTEKPQAANDSASLEAS
jgi:hypothetical protein